MTLDWRAGCELPELWEHLCAGTMWPNTLYATIRPGLVDKELVGACTHGSMDAALLWAWWMIARVLLHHCGTPSQRMLHSRRICPLPARR